MISIKTSSQEFKDADDIKSYQKRCELQHKICLICHVNGTNWAMYKRYYSESYHVTRYLELTYSNAYYKLWEILDFLNKTYDIENNCKIIKHFDNGALPGDFIRAASNYFKITGVPYTWKACSYIDPENKHDFIGDRYDLLRNFPNNWVMDRNIDGDILNKKSIRNIVKKLGKGSVNLYTSDLGFQFNDRFDEEGEYAEYYKSQCLLGLKLLAIGGVMICKQFGLHNDETREIIKMISSFFKHTYILKPFMSKHDNSESYICFVDYVGESVNEYKCSISNLIHISNTLLTRQNNAIEKIMEDAANEEMHDTEDTARYFMINLKYSDF
jgi:23S rRNA U2552 (ribose-2'-O)-methylase RlmE/FtsJ